MMQITLSYVVTLLVKHLLLYNFVIIKGCLCITKFALISGLVIPVSDKWDKVVA